MCDLETVVPPEQQHYKLFENSRLALELDQWPPQMLIKAGSLLLLEILNTARIIDQDGNEIPALIHTYRLKKKK